MILSTEKNVKFLFEFFISKEDTVIPFDIATCHDAVLRLLKSFAFFHPALFFMKLFGACS